MANRRNDINESTNRRSEVNEPDNTSTARSGDQHNYQRECRSIQQQYTETYCVHLTNLPSNITADKLQYIVEQELGFNRIGVGDILMYPPGRICWICNIEDEALANDLARKLDSTEIENGELICAQKKLQDPEYCKVYRTGQCKQTSCLFDHVLCTSQDNQCPLDCPKGHQIGVKEEKIYIPSNEFQNYKIKILGLPLNQQPNTLAEEFRHRKPNQIIVSDRSALIINLKSIKYAKRLVERLHKQEYARNFIMECQLELNIKSVLHQRQTQQHDRFEGNNLSKSSNNISGGTDHIATTKTEARNDSDDDNEPDDISDILPRALTVNDLIDPGRAFGNTIQSIKRQSEADKKSSSSVVSKGLEPSGLPHDVPTKWRKPKKSETRSGGEGEVTKICLSTDEKMTAVIKVYKHHTPTRKMRAIREITALKRVKDLMNVSHLYSDDTDLITNVPDKLSDTMNGTDHTTFWAIMTHINGVTMKEFVTQRYAPKQMGFNLVDALTFTEKLLCIVKAIHSKGVVHRDLKTDNIMVSFENYSDQIANAELSVIDFGLAYIETQEKIEIDWSTYDQIDDETDPGDSIGNRWYRVPQLDRQDVSQMTSKEKNDLFHVIRRSPTIDGSSICAIFFWMLTEIVPRENRDKNTNSAPHQRESAKIKAKIDNVISSMTNLSNDEREMLAKRLQLYLMTTFDKGFEFPDRQWTLEQLDYRLQLIRRVLESHKAPSLSTETLDDVSDELLRLGDATISAVSLPNEPRSPLDKAASAFRLAKAKFIEKHRRSYKWTDGNCQWLDDVHNMTERKHYDTLTYYLLNQSWSIIICCTANVNESGKNVLLSIGSIVHGLYIGIPIGKYETNPNSPDKIDICSNFETELKNLVYLVCKRKEETR